jgi:hemerythrin-like domain-containing protein
MNLWDTPAGFDEPLAALSACHRRIEKQMATLLRLQKHVGKSGFDEDARIATAAILRYFQDAAPHHHADEEVDLFPKVLRAAEASADRARAFDLVSHLLVDHRDMEAAWAGVRKALEGLQSGKKSTLDSQLCKDFSRNYSSHIAREDNELFPLAARLLSKPELQSLGTAMALRRGLPPPVFDRDSQ